MHMQFTGMQCLQRLEEGTRSPGTAVLGRCEPPHTLRKSTEPSLQAPKWETVARASQNIKKGISAAAYTVVNVFNLTIKCPSWVVRIDFYLIAFRPKDSGGKNLSCLWGRAEGEF